MKTQRKFRTLIGIELFFLALLFGFIAFLGLEEAAYYRGYEFLGATMALILTTYGVYKMRELT